MLTLLNISKLYSIKLLTKGRGVKKVQNHADVLCESPVIFIKIVYSKSLHSVCLHFYAFFGNNLISSCTICEEMNVGFFVFSSFFAKNQKPKKM